MSVAGSSKMSFSFAPYWVPLKYSIQAHASTMYLLKLSFQLPLIRLPAIVLLSVALRKTPAQLPFYGAVQNKVVF
jgi:hypothetical protein